MGDPMPVDQQEQSSTDSVVLKDEISRVKSAIVRRFVPRVVVKRFEEKSDGFENNQEEIKSTVGVVGFFDISGFSTLANKLETLEKGRRFRKKQLSNRYSSAATYHTAALGTGAEQLATKLNETLQMLVNLILQSGGDIIKFAGDALIVVWTGSLQEVPVILAVACDCALRCTEFTVEATSSLHLHTGIGCGEILMCHAGGERDRWEFFIAGDANTQAAEAEALSARDQVVVSGVALQQLKKLEDLKVVDFEYYSVRDSRFARIKTLIMQRKNSKNIEFPPMVDLTVIPPVNANVLNLAKAYIPRPVMQMIESNSASVNELRKVSVIFFSLTDSVHIPMTKYFEPEQTKDETEMKEKQIQFLTAIQHRIKAVQDAAYSQWGTLRQFIIDDKGFVAIVVIGLPPHYFEDNAARAIKVAAALIHTNGIPAKAGICTGTVFCGAIGSEYRAEYSVTGDCINLAARLMGKAKPNTALCDEMTANEVRTNHPWIKFETIENLKVKGYEDSVAAFCPELLPLSSGNNMVQSHNSTGNSVVHSIRSRESGNNTGMPQNSSSYHFNAANSSSEFNAIGQEELKEEISRATFCSKTKPCKAIFIEGAPGSGKTHITQWAVSMFPDSVRNVFYSVCEASESKTPFFAWRPILLEMLKLDNYDLKQHQASPVTENGNNNASALGASSRSVPTPGAPATITTPTTASSKKRSSIRGFLKLGGDEEKITTTNSLGRGRRSSGIRGIARSKTMTHMERLSDKRRLSNLLRKKTSTTNSNVADDSGEPSVAMSIEEGNDTAEHPSSSPLTKIAKFSNVLTRSLSMGAGAQNSFVDKTSPNRKSNLSAKQVTHPLLNNKRESEAITAKKKPTPLVITEEQQFYIPNELEEDEEVIVEEGSPSSVRSSPLVEAPSNINIVVGNFSLSGGVPDVESESGIPLSSSCHNLEHLLTRGATSAASVNTSKHNPSKLVAANTAPVAAGKQSPLKTNKKRLRAGSTAAAVFQTNKNSLGGRFLQVSTHSGDQHIAEMSYMIQKLRESGKLKNRRLSSLGHVLPGFFFPSNPTSSGGTGEQPIILERHRVRTGSDMSASEVASSAAGGVFTFFKSALGGESSVPSSPSSMLRRSTTDHGAYSFGDRDDFGLTATSPYPLTTYSSTGRIPGDHIGGESPHASASPLMNAMSPSGFSSPKQSPVSADYTAAFPQQQQSPQPPAQTFIPTVDDKETKMSVNTSVSNQVGRRYSSPVAREKPTEKDDIMELMLALLDEAGNLGPVVIIIDDAHHMDDDSWELLRRAIISGKVEMQDKQQVSIVQNQMVQPQDFGGIPSSASSEASTSSCQASFTLVGPNVRFVVTYRPVAHMETNSAWRDILELCSYEEGRTSSSSSVGSLSSASPSPSFDIDDASTYSEQGCPPTRGSVNKRIPPWLIITSVRPLTQRECASFLSAYRGVGIGSELIRFLYQQTKGNPGYLMNLFNGLMEQQLVRVDPITGVAQVMEGLEKLPSENVLLLSLPGHFVADVYKRFDKLGKNAQLILKLASAIGKLVPTDLLLYVYCKKQQLMLQTSNSTHESGGRDESGNSEAEERDLEAEEGGSNLMSEILVNLFNPGDESGDSDDDNRGDSTVEETSTPTTSTYFPRGSFGATWSSSSSKRNSTPGSPSKRSKQSSRRLASHNSSSSADSSSSDANNSSSLSNGKKKKRKLKKIDFQVLEREFHAAIVLLKSVNFISEQIPKGTGLSGHPSIVFKEDSERCVIYNMMLNIDKRMIHRFILEWHEQENDLQTGTTFTGFDLGMLGYHAMLSEQYLKAFAYFESGIRDSLQNWDRESVECFAYSCKDIIESPEFMNEVERSKSERVRTAYAVSLFKCKTFLMLAQFYIMMRAWDDCKSYLNLAIQHSRYVMEPLRQGGVMKRFFRYLKLKTNSSPRKPEYILAKFKELDEEVFLFESQKTLIKARRLIKKLAKMEKAMDQFERMLDLAMIK